MTRKIKVDMKAIKKMLNSGKILYKSPVRKREVVHDFSNDCFMYALRGGFNGINIDGDY